MNEVCMGNHTYPLFFVFLLSFLKLFRPEQLNNQKEKKIKKG
jgi:hypothetical protein